MGKRCGFTLTPEVVRRRGITFEGGVEGYEYIAGTNGLDEWNAVVGASCCWRPIQDDDVDGCVWHAEHDNKPVADLVSARVRGPENLDGAVVEGVPIQNAVSFAGCSLRAARFAESDLSKADLSDADLQWADLSDALLSQADLSGAEFYLTDLSGARFYESNLSGATIETQTFFSGVNFHGTNLSGTTIRGVDSVDVRFKQADLSGARLLWSTLSNATFIDANLSGATLDEYTTQQSVATDGSGDVDD